MTEAAEQGTLLGVRDPATGLTAETFSARGWTCVRVVRYALALSADGTESLQAAGTARCVKGKRQVTWQIIATAPPT